MMEMHLYRPLADKEAVRNLSVVEPPGHQTHQFYFSQRQRFGKLLQFGFASKHPIQGTAEGMSFQPSFASANLAQTLKQKKWRHFLQHDAAYIEADGFQHLLFAQFEL